MMLARPLTTYLDVSVALCLVFGLLSGCDTAPIGTDGGPAIDAGGGGVDAGGGGADAGGVDAGGSGDAGPPADVFTQLAAASSYTCGLRASGSVECWGSNEFGQLGNGTTDDQHTPTPVTGLTDAVQISAGGTSTCAVRASGEVWCWGYNGFGQLGDGTTDNSSAPVQVGGISGAVEVASSNSHSCARLATGSIMCWGDPENGKLGDNGMGTGATPTSVIGITNATSVRAGHDHTCALADGEVRCWGPNYALQLGVPAGPECDSYPCSKSPATVSLGGVVQVSPGIATCARLTDSTARCWGSRMYGQVGDGVTGANTYMPQTVLDLSEVIDIAGGGNHVCAVVLGGGVRCWGANFQGQLGDSTTTDANSPVTVSGLSDAATLALGGEHSCALLRSGAYRCWGNNSHGQLGDGTTEDRSAP